MKLVVTNYFTESQNLRKDYGCVREKQTLAERSIGDQSFIV